MLRMERRSAVGSCALLALLGWATAGCGGTSSYELHWKIRCDEQADGCLVRNARDCSAAGIGAVEVGVVSNGGTKGRSFVTFPCFSAASGPAGRGPDLGAGRYQLRVTPLSLSGQPVGTTDSVSVDVPDEGYKRVDIVLAHPAQCSDGIDNDDDGLVDLFDPGCKQSGDGLER